MMVCEVNEDVLLSDLFLEFLRLDICSQDFRGRNLALQRYHITCHNAAAIRISLQCPLFDTFTVR
jgi:hypothetical protein